MLKCDYVLIDQCVMKPCENGATCIAAAAVAYTCACAPGYAGMHCEIGEREILASTYKQEGLHEFTCCKCILLSKECALGPKHTLGCTICESKAGKLSMKPGYIKVLISTGDYYEDTLRDEN